MCGICGIHFPGHVDPNVLGRMNDRLAHRGPDDAGIYTDASVGLASRRLAIIDLVSGHMPISNEDGSVWVVQNGEIYNFRQLRRDLEHRGHRFTTKTDTEVLVHLYEEHGEELFTHLRGMYAIALWDRRKATLLLGRDRIGKKPLYYSYDGKRLLFASEIKALRQVPDLHLSLDWEALNLYFAYSCIPDPWSIYKEVRKLPPAHWLKLHDGKVEIRSYWDLDFQNAHPEGDERWYVEELRQRLEDAVRCRLVSDVPLGAFLSGGLDSALVVGLMSRIQERPVQTFSIGFDEETFDELRFARIAARAFGTEHHEEILRPHAVDLIENLVDAFDEPFGDSSALPTYLVSQVARRHVTVALSGDGGDEAFAGYQAHLIHQRDERFHRAVPAPLRSALGGSLAAGARLSGTYRLRRMAGAVRRAARPLAERYAVALDQATRRQFFSPDTLRQIGTLRDQEHLAESARSQSFPDFLARILYVDTKNYLPQDILVKVDRMSMAHSLEVRSPLIDHHVLEFAARIPSHLKLRGNVSKYILKKVAEPLVPREIVYREKHGFGVPLRHWFREDLRDLVHSQLLHPGNGAMALFEHDFVARMVAEHEANRWDWSVQLWTLLMFSVWYEKYAPGS